MAISKTQPMRSAEIDLIDIVNAQDSTLASHTQAINTLSTDLDAEVAERERMDTYISGLVTDEAEARRAAIATLTDSLSATNQQVSLMNDDLNDVETAVTDIQSDLAGIATDVANLLLFEGRIQIGNVTNLTIPANDSISTSENFAQPFDSESDCIVLAQVVTSELSTLFTFTLIDRTYSGFSYSITNSDADAHTVSLGYVAIRTSA